MVIFDSFKILIMVIDNHNTGIMFSLCLRKIYIDNVRHTMKGMKENALSCKHTGGKPPLGYRVERI